MKKKLTDKEKLKNITKEFGKLLMMLQEKFPIAWDYYTERLHPPHKRGK